MSSLNVNTIGEYTSGNGVTIDGALIKDGKVTGGAAGLTLVTSGSVSAVTGITLDNVFTSTFPNYLFQFQKSQWCLNEKATHILFFKLSILYLW